jgi:PadR family transcriptional regulator PadR
MQYIVLNFHLALYGKTNLMTIDNTESQMRKGLLELCILGIIHKEEEAYPSDILEQLKAAKLVVLEGTLYPLLTRLKNADMLSYRWEESPSGPPRKYYSLTKNGLKFYSQLRHTWDELSNAVNHLTTSI